MRGAGVLAVAERHDQRRQLRAQTWRERSEGFLRLGLTPGAIAAGGVVMSSLALGLYAGRKWAVGGVAPATSRTLTIRLLDKDDQAKVGSAAECAAPEYTTQPNYSYILRLATILAVHIRGGATHHVKHYVTVKTQFPGVARRFYDTYDAVAQHVGVSAGDAPLGRIRICVPKGLEREYTAAFRAAERVVTYWLGFTGDDPPPSMENAQPKVTLHGAGFDLLRFPYEGPDICQFVSAVASPSGSAGSGANQVSDVATPVVGIMVDATAGILDGVYGRNRFVESWLRAERPGELTDTDSDFLSAAGLPQRQPWPHAASYLLEILRTVSGAETTDENARVVRVVRNASIKTKPAHGMKSATCTVMLFFVFAGDAPTGKTPDGVAEAHHVASVKAGFDAMIREGVSVAAIDLRMRDVHFFSRGGGMMNRTSIVKKALGGVVSGSPNSATYADYIPTVAVDGESNWKQGLGDPQAELYTTGPD